MHTLPSEQTVPFKLASAVYAHAPVAKLQLSLVHGLPSLQLTTAPYRQLPPPQWSPVVQALPSLHGALLGVCAQPLALTQESSVHGLLSSQFSAPLPTQTPAKHASLGVHRLPSEQPAPLRIAPLCVQLPSPGLQLSAVQGLPSSQLTSAVGTHWPPVQWSPAVQPLPSVQVAVLASCAQPLVGVQVPVVQALPSSQFSAPLAVQLPAWQLSPVVQRLPSSQTAPFAAATCLQPAEVSQESTVHGRPSSQPSVVAYRHVPPEQWSPTVHALPSEQLAVPSGGKKQPLAALHLLSVHGLLSSHASVPAPAHVPPAQLSPVVHRSPSLHGPMDGLCWQPSAASQLSIVHGWASSQPIWLPGVHTEFAQVSPVVQTLPSSQVAVLARCTQPVLALQPSSVHGLPSLQSNALPGWHAPVLHKSPIVQAFPSVHAPVLGVCAQPPWVSQASVVHGLPSLQSCPGPGKHTALKHASPVVHGLPSSHGPEIALCVQPAPALQPSSVHGLPSSHASPLPETQFPPRHASPLVQTLPSEHTAPSSFVLVHPLEMLQESLVQTLPSSQSSGAPPWQLPDLHVSATVHALPSSHAALVGLCVQPLPGLQPSAVHGLSSLQLVALPGVQTALTQLSPNVHALPSEHVAEFGKCAQPLSGAQRSAVHGLPSSQPRSPAPAHTPAAQWSPVVHKLPSVQVFSSLLVAVQPLAGSQLSLVQALPSSQVKGTPDAQLPDLQTSPSVHASPSEHAPPMNGCWQPSLASHKSAVHGFWSSQSSNAASWQAPKTQWSPVVQMLPSSHGPGIGGWWQVPEGGQVSSVHGLPSSHLVTSLGRLGSHSPPLQSATQVAEVSPIFTEQMPSPQ